MLRRKFISFLILILFFTVSSINAYAEEVYSVNLELNELDSYFFHVVKDGVITNKNAGTIIPDVNTMISDEISLEDLSPPVITIEPYSTEWTNQDITVKAKTSKGTLNQDSYTFTENGSFTFVATDEAGNRVEEEIIITNIDKIKPTMKITVGK